MPKHHIRKEGQPCRKCHHPVIRKAHPEGWKPKPGRVWFEWWFYCKGCRALYMTEEAKRFADGGRKEKELSSEAEAYANQLYLTHREEF